MCVRLPIGRSKEPEHVQNPKLIGYQGLVGEIDLGIRFDGRDDVVSILLHFAEGNKRLGSRLVQLS